ncbi:MAG: histidine phosphatase family protein [Hymenobacteraceae bacterium]|nr:histidine phosphatase family protein [Hymenobacteraceae bacterium]
MKTLYLMRHAKSDQDYVDLADRDRPLAERGRRDAPFMAQQLLAREVSPLDLIICSPAVRTLSTATLVAKELDLEPLKIQVEDTLYEADREAYLDIISQLKSSLEEVMIVGHNNTITDVANYLSPQFVPELPTAGIVCLRFDTLSWKNLARDSAEFGFFDFPKNYDL